MKKNHHIAPEVKEQIVKRITTIYGWLGAGARNAPSWVEVAKLRRENKALLELVGEITLKLSESQKKN